MRVVALAATGFAALAACFALVPTVLRHRPAPSPALFHGTTSVIALPIAGGRPREVLRLPGQWGFPVATADGRALVLEKPYLDRTDLWRVPLDGGPRRRVGRMDVYRQPPQRSPLVHLDAAGRLIARDPRSGATHVVAKPVYPGLTFGVSADGRTVYATRMNDATSIPK